MLGSCTRTRLKLIGSAGQLLMGGGSEPRLDAGLLPGAELFKRQTELYRRPLQLSGEEGGRMLTNELATSRCANVVNTTTRAPCSRTIRQHDSHLIWGRVQFRYAMLLFSNSG